MTTVYCIYTPDGELLYIGQTKHLYARISRHTKSRKSSIRSWMRKNKSSVEFRIVGNYSDPSIAKEVEARMINKMKPPMNKYCAGDNFRSKYVARPKRGHAKTRVAVTNG